VAGCADGAEGCMAECAKRYPNFEYAGYDVNPEFVNRVKAAGKS